jgi:hypothetical protein
MAMAFKEFPTDTDLLKAKARLPKHVVYRTFVYETVILNLESGTYHGLNPSAGRMLETLERAESVGEAAESLAAEFGQPLDTIRADLTAFCSDLSDRGLIVLAQQSSE